MSGTVMRLALVVVVLLAACGNPAPPAAPAPAAELVLVATDDEGVAIGGHDPVSYVADGTPAPGTEDHASEHGGATYLFVSSEHKATFDADPARHLPAYGGYCAYAASQGRLTPADPTVWQVHDGRLLLFANQGFHDLFNQDPVEHTAAADRNWPGLVARHGEPIE
jgi:YHS domain-containing protein